MKKPNPRALSTLLTWTFARHKWTGRNAKDRPHRRSYEIVVNDEGEFLVCLTGWSPGQGRAGYSSLARAKLHAANEEQSLQRTEDGV